LVFNVASLGRTFLLFFILRNIVKQNQGFEKRNPPHACENTVDVAARSAIYQEIQEILVQDMPYLWVVETTATRAYSSRCSGFTASGHFAATARCDP
jgi:hypothetical protein